jgi:transcription antitermination factor NusG
MAAAWFALKASIRAEQDTARLALTESRFGDEFSRHAILGCRENRANRERLAYENVVLRGFEVFVPKIRTRIGGQWKTVGLFPCYLFVRVVDRWRAIERSPGVLSLIKFGEQHGRLLERSDRDGIIRLPARPPPPSRSLALGASVTIGDGLFRGLDGVYAGMTTHERELVLINILGASRPVEISTGLIVPQ